MLIIAIVGIGLLFSFKLGFIQIRGFNDDGNRTFVDFLAERDAGKDGMSSFQALATAIAAQVVTGNIAGAATAIAVVGPVQSSGCGSAHSSNVNPIFAESVMAQSFKQSVMTEP